MKMIRISFDIQQKISNPNECDSLFLERTESLRTEFVALAYLQKDNLRRKDCRETKESLEHSEWELEDL
jgi:hypothetical protein